MNTWMNAWMKSMGVHILLGAFVMGVLYVGMDNQILRPKGIAVHIGAKGGHGQGGKYKTLPTGDNLPLQDAMDKESMGAHDEHMLALAKAAIAETSAIQAGNVASTNHGTAAGSTQETGGVQGVRGSNGNGNAEYGMGSGEGGIGNGYGHGSGDMDGTGYASNGDGSYTAMSPDGLDYSILYEVYPEGYPEKAYEAGYSRTVIVEARFLVDTDGRVASVEIMNHVPDLGFREATENALYQWRFAPITYHGHPLKVYFTKRIRFVSNR